MTSDNLSAEETPFRLIEDNDGHWYVIRVSVTDRFNDWISAIENDGPASYADWDYFESCRVDGPHAVHFGKWSER